MPREEILGRKVSTKIAVAPFNFCHFKTAALRIL
jgi:hypothetical protein